MLLRIIRDRTYESGYKGTRFFLASFRAAKAPNRVSRKLQRKDIIMTARRLPPWIRSCLPPASSAGRIHRWTYARGLSTVCREAHCPNQGECFESGTATFLILGDTCTRNCSFCAVTHGTPDPPRPDEPDLVASSVRSLGLRFVVVTSVTRDDLPDGGAGVFAATIRAIRRECPGVGIEVLIPDFQGSRQALAKVIDARPDVINHNLETVPELYPALRPEASYERSLDLLHQVRQCGGEIVPKSGIMVGAGETREQFLSLVRALVGVGCGVLTVGQYLQPSPRHHPVERFLPPEEFDELRELALSEGLKGVAAGPLVRSSYSAGDVWEKLIGASTLTGP
ncbi:lipoyl synthase [Thermodesulfobacteriota bacterium]